VITGAGVSAESGLPTYRGDDGLWRRRSPYELATPEAFAAEPEVVWEWYRERRAELRGARPNAAHHAIARLAREVPDPLLVTQNVDDLHERAGFPADALIHIHGELLVDRCSRCDYRARDQGDETPPPSPPRCPRCGSAVRPGVVWFGESLDVASVERVVGWLTDGPVDATLVVGTTAVFPYIVDWALWGSRGGGRLYEVNPEETPISAHAWERRAAPAGSAVPALVERLLAG
jgi:NAD-dependent deacetylase